MVIPRAELERIAREATREALTKAVRPYGDLSELWKNVVLGERDQDGNRIFELYIPNRRPEDAIFLSRTVVDRSTGDVKVEVFVDNILTALRSPPPAGGRGIDF